MMRHRRAVGAGVLAALVVLSGCGGSSKAPTSLSLHGDKIPVTTLRSGLQQMCQVTHQANNSEADKTTYFSGPYNALHQLAGIVGGSRQTELLSAMQALELDFLTIAGSGGAIKDSNALLATVNRDLQSLKVAPVKC